MAKSFATKNSDTRLMIEGLKANKETVAKMGIDDEFIQKFEAQYEAVKTADTAQEKAKSDLYTATKAVKEADKERDTSYAFARKVVKLTSPKSDGKNLEYTAKHKEENQHNCDKTLSKKNRKEKNITTRPNASPLPNAFFSVPKQDRALKDAPRSRTS